MSNENHGRDWGFASYDVDNLDDKKLIYIYFK